MLFDNLTQELEPEDFYWEEYSEVQTPERGRFDALALVAMALILFMVFKVLVDRAQSNTGSVQLTESFIEIIDQESIWVPYDDYVLTQGPHGKSYGHLAVDLAAGENSVIKSPINGQVSDIYMDEYGNPTLVIENEVYQVTMLHGKYSVQQGDTLELGQPVGYESNIGYTTDMQGRPCKNRDCGYHTHLNIFDKRVNRNVNPLEVLELR